MRFLRWAAVLFFMQAGALAAHDLLDQVAALPTLQSTGKHGKLALRCLEEAFLRM
jgi:hypothetical protein